MALEIKNLATGYLKKLGGPVLLYAAPRIGDFGVTVTRTALVTGMRFSNRNPIGGAAVTFNLYFVRHNSAQPEVRLRPWRHIVKVNQNVDAGKVFEINLPLALEEGDAIVGDAVQSNIIEYIISGVEREVS
jgi:hypothetical protein